MHVCATRSTETKLVYACVRARVCVCVCVCVCIAGTALKRVSCLRKEAE